jgi:hypothetical protein
MAPTNFSLYLQYNMKYLFYFLMVFPLSAFSQECKVKKGKDPFSQENKISTGFKSLGNMRMTIDADKKEINFLFTLNNTGTSKCFDDASTLTMILEDGKTKLNFKNTGTMNCEGFFQFTMRNTPVTQSYLQRLTTKKVRTIRFTHNKVHADYTLTEEYKQTLVDLSICMAKEAKTLLN